MSENRTFSATVKFDNGQVHVYQNVPSDTSYKAIEDRAEKEFPGIGIAEVTKGITKTAPEKTAFQSFIEGLQNPEIPEGRTPIAGAALAGLGGETLKNIGAATQLVSPNAGTPLVEAGQAITEGASRVAPISTGIGQIGSYVAPANMLMKGANLAYKSTSLLPEIAKGATTSGLLGYATTPGTPSDRLLGTALDTAIGAGAPIVGKLVKPLVEPLYEKGREQILGRFLRESAGSDADKAIANMQNAKPAIPGSEPTVGQIADVPSLATLERSALATGTPEAQNIIATRKAAQDKARVEALQNIAPQSRVSKYQALRERVGEDLYEPALSVKMDFTKLSPELKKEAGNLTQAPAIKNAMVEARQNALNKGIDIKDPSGSLRGLHQTKMALDDEIAKLRVIDPTGSQKAKLDALNTAKTRLLDFIEKVSPEYKQARETYNRLSKPIDQLETIQNLSNKAIRSDEEKVLYGNFFRELDKAKENGVLSKQQLARLDAVAEDLKRTKFAEDSGRGVGSDTAQKLVYGNILNQMDIPYYLRRHPAAQVTGGVLGRVASPIYADAERQLKTKLAELLMNPQEAANVMKNAKLAKNAGISDAETLAKVLMMPEYFKENK